MAKRKTTTKKVKEKKVVPVVPKPKVLVVENQSGHHLQIAHDSGSYKLSPGITRDVPRSVCESPHFEDLASGPNPKVVLSEE